MSKKSDIEEALRTSLARSSRMLGFKGMSLNTVPVTQHNSPCLTSSTRSTCWTFSPAIWTSQPSVEDEGTIQGDIPGSRSKLLVQVLQLPALGSSGEESTCLHIAVYTLSARLWRARKTEEGCTMIGCARGSAASHHCYHSKLRRPRQDKNPTSAPAAIAAASHLTSG